MNTHVACELPASEKLVGIAPEECDGSVIALSPCEVTWEVTVWPAWGRGFSDSTLCTLILAEDSRYHATVRCLVTTVRDFLV